MAEQDTGISNLSFEQALAELEAIVSRLEQGNIPLEESITCYERGEALKKHCDALLKKAESRVERITLGADGSPQGFIPLADAN